MSNDGVNYKRRRVLTAMTTAVGAVGIVGAAVPFVGSWRPSARARAAGAPVEFNISKLEPGQLATVEWRGRPVFVVRRTPEALEGLELMEPALSDPTSQRSVQPEYATNITRAIKPEILVLLGLCTHLGCAPGFHPEVGSLSTGVAGVEWQGGFFCKCHGSTFDLAGRVLRGVPAPINLEIPPHRYVSDSVIVIGEDQEA